MKHIKRLLVLLACAGAACAGLVSFLAHNACIDVEAFERYDPGRPTIVLDAHGQEWARFALEKREQINIEDMPKHLIDAFLAAEDWHFYEHCGLSFKGIVRSFLVNLYHGRVVQGASTITQQLVRLLFFDHRRTFSRKIKEQCTALLVELQFSKDQILQTYLNHVYFSCGIYGVQAAAQRFWGIQASQVSIAQAAALAGIMRSPGMYSPLLHPDATERRRAVVLGQMVHLGFITQEAYERAMQEPLAIITPSKEVIGLHARDRVRKELERMVGNTLYTGGYVVHTTLDMNLQRAAERAFSEQMSRIRATINPAADGGLLSVEVSTGKIRALIGGAEYACSKFNRAFQARRQLGSVFKVLVFAAAVRQGMKFCDVEVDEPLEVLDAWGKAWRPQNYDQQFHGPVTLAYALSRSNNIVVIKTFLRTGAEAVISLAEKARLPGPFHRYASLALGCVDVTLLQAVGMFNLFANHGTYVEPHLISRVKDMWGSTLWSAHPERETVLPAHISGQVLKVLGLGLERVRSSVPQAWIDSRAASKTGTTNDFRTCWFLGSTPELTTGVYVGCDDNRPMGENVYPIHTAFPVWMAFHRQVATQVKEFWYDPSLKEVLVEEKSGKRVSDARKKGVVKLLV